MLVVAMLLMAVMAPWSPLGPQGRGTQKPAPTPARPTFFTSTLPEAEIRNKQAVLETTLGTIVIDLLAEKAPNHVAHFITRAREGAYDGTTFHRVIPNFMIQGGDPIGTGTGGPGYTFNDEIHLELNFTEPYVLAMANAGKRFGKGTNGSQFFITVGPTPHLNRRHTIFGEVADPASQAVVDEIAAVPTGRADRPVEPVVITSVDVSE